eukprot:CAMPEP_0185774048 /NCGR_PEP_ID=MMETSP1174-20130828/76512_1 /TAXON_ID=35687 /ORGANISM="Dictyocha speculum, Strain CCMP1381" /LENGTH=174 /DNA_ID=CAMNT_0028461041 /DNA_START=383 /DNA_END=907 /DNA_ORIENTATION=-
MEEVTAASPAPVIREDPRIIGDWELIGTTSPNFSERQGLTGLGSAPFTSPRTIFFKFVETGDCVAKEVLEFFGRPVVVNECRGKFAFNSDGDIMQEKYSEADIGGQRNTNNFGGATATLLNVCITADGGMRVARLPDEFGDARAFFVFKKLKPKELNVFLEREGLPVIGGTVMG